MKKQNGITLLTLGFVIVVYSSILWGVTIPNFKRYKFMKDCNQDKESEKICVNNNKVKNVCGKDYSREQYCQKNICLLNIVLI